jgi:hypothetical protein
MKTFDIFILIIFALIFLSFIDRWYFRKIVILSREKFDSERFKIQAKTYVFFNLIKVDFEFIEFDNKFYSVMQKSFFDKTKTVSTEEVEPRFMKKALLKYKLENGLND